MCPFQSSVYSPLCMYLTKSKTRESRTLKSRIRESRTRESRTLKSRTRESRTLKSRTQWDSILHVQYCTYTLYSTENAVSGFTCLFSSFCRLSSKRLIAADISLAARWSPSSSLLVAVWRAGCWLDTQASHFSTLAYTTVWSLVLRKREFYQWNLEFLREIQLYVHYQYCSLQDHEY